jgi:hypothetical protein
MKKFTVFVLCIVLGFCVAVDGDTIVLRNNKENIRLEVIGVTEGFVTVSIQKKDLKALNMQFLTKENYSDVVFWNEANVSVECKVVKITEDSIQIMIPTAKISLLQMTFGANEGQDNELPVSTGNDLKAVGTASVEKETGRGNRENAEGGVREKLEQSLLTDKLKVGAEVKTSEAKQYRLRTKKESQKNLAAKDGVPTDVVSGGTGGIKTGKGLDEEIRENEEERKGYTKGSDEDVEREKPDIQHAVQDATLGRVEGKILQSGKPLPDCEVKLQVLEKGGILAKGYRPVEGAVDLETSTNNDGIYYFDGVSPGLYKLYWKPHSETTWIRRFKMEPDVIVESGKTAKPKDIETLKRTLN